MVSRPRRREGIGFGERLSESLAFIVIVGALIYGAYYYFAVFQRSPNATLGRFMGELKSGNADAQYAMLAESTRTRYFPTRDVYKEKYPGAQGYAGRMSDFTINKVTAMGDKAEADVTVSVRKSGQELYQVAGENYNDHFVLKRGSEGWKIVLEASQLKSDAALARR